MDSFGTPEGIYLQPEANPSNVIFWDWNNENILTLRSFCCLFGLFYPLIFFLEEGGEGWGIEKKKKNKSDGISWVPDCAIVSSEAAFATYNSS